MTTQDDQISIDREHVFHFRVAECDQDLLDLAALLETINGTIHNGSIHSSRSCRGSAFAVAMRDLLFAVGSMESDLEAATKRALLSPIPISVETPDGTKKQTVLPNGGATVVISHDGIFGVSVCSRLDNYSKKRGLSICRGRIDAFRTRKDEHVMAPFAGWVGTATEWVELARAVLAPAINWGVQAWLPLRFAYKPRNNVLAPSAPFVVE